MTTRLKILRMVESLKDDVTFDQVIYHLEVMKKIEERLAEAEHEEGMEKRT